ncbi:unnamed protein product [Bursaphelenchus xylophilus]|uniref:(pine wood nematode) hypothetical protein n=1 Tax=Bursaphelenchus xylophilus TaxID=6326 RepID=A0A1I7SRH8_BURXY|nr:unnamed protein product [Bursaphelenchus xylophilus]CAG9102364.1 unnamed protein product [Bursaphelenchus xylophilus]
MLLKTAILCCFYFVQASGCLDFKLPVFFGDSGRLRRDLLIDLTTDENFVLDAKTFKQRYGDRRVYDPKASATFKNRTKRFYDFYPVWFIQNYSSVHGYVGEDIVRILSHPVKAKFGVVTSVEGEGSIETCDGRGVAGRLGLSRGNGTTNLGSVFMRDRSQAVLCLSAISERAMIYIGDFIYDKHDFLAKVPVVPDLDVLWKVKLEKLEFIIGGARTYAYLEAILSTTLPGISLPSPVFSATIRALDAKYDHNSGNYFVDCGKEFSLSFEVQNDKIIEVKLEDFTKKVGDQCILLLKSHYASKFVVLGQVYFKDPSGCVDFKLPVFFADSGGLQRDLLIDIATTENFVLNARTFKQKYGDRRVYDPKASKTFKTSDRRFYGVFPVWITQNYSTVYGYIGEDIVRILSHPVEASFGVVTVVKGEDSVKTCDGQGAAGRLGLSRGRGTTNLGSVFIKDRQRAILCLSAISGKAMIYIGDFIYDKQDLLVKVPVYPDFDVLWKVQLRSLIVGEKTYASPLAILSTTLPGISLPEPMFGAAIQALGAEYDNNTRNYFVDCGKNFSLFFEVQQGTIIEVKLEEFTKKLEDQCILLLENHYIISFVVLGQAYFEDRGYCLDFDKKEVHFYNHTEHSGGLWKKYNGKNLFIN